MGNYPIQTVNGVGSGSAYQAALWQEVVRRVAPGDRLDAELDKLMRDRQYSEDEYFARFCDWTKLDSVAWTYLLAATDQFDDKCDFSQFDGVAWVYLVKQRRELARFLNRKELNDRDGSRVDRILRSS